MFQVIWTHMFYPQGGLSCWNPDRNWDSGAAWPGVRSGVSPCKPGLVTFQP